MNSRINDCHIFLTGTMQITHKLLQHFVEMNEQRACMHTVYLHLGNGEMNGIEGKILVLIHVIDISPEKDEK